jgi:hypothetical protein
MLNPSLQGRRMRPLLVLATLLPLASAGAQPRSPMNRPQHATLTLVAGLSQWDLSGTGNSVIFAGRVDYPVGPPWLLGEGSLAGFHADEQGGGNTYVIPEVQLQIQVPRALAPYLGVGAGAFVRGSGTGGDRSSLTTSAAVGIRLWEIVPRAVLRAELRIRGIGSEFTGSAAEWTGGIGWSF